MLTYFTPYMMVNGIFKLLYFFINLGVVLITFKNQYISLDFVIKIFMLDIYRLWNIANAESHIFHI